MSICVMRWMHTQEFNVFEKGCADILGWLQWHWNVPSMLEIIMLLTRLVMW
jgi:hypothetical protein